MFVLNCLTLIYKIKLHNSAFVKRQDEGEIRLIGIREDGTVWVEVFSGITILFLAVEFLPDILFIQTKINSKKNSVTVWFA